MASQKYLDSLIWALIYENNCISADNTDETEKKSQEIELFNQINKILKRDCHKESDSNCETNDVYKSLNEMYKKYYSLSQEGEYSVRIGRFLSDFQPENIDTNNFNGYSMVGYISEGSFGKVFKVRNKIDDQLYAVKKIYLES
jgi:hypothetical protein